jgi:sugar lactone lactonase YvrE
MPRVTVVAMRVFLLLVFLAGSLSAAVPTPSHRDLFAESESAYSRKDYAAARVAIAAALHLRPDSPRYLYRAAALAALTGRPDEALVWLREVAGLGVYMPAERDRDFAAVQGQPAFMQVLGALAANRAPRGEITLVAELPGRTGVLEGVALHRRTGDLFFGDVHHRCIWKRDRNGQVTRFSAEDEELLGVFGLAIDESRNTLWAATAAVPEMSGFTKEMRGVAALAEFNLATSELRRVLTVPGDGRDHLLGDLVVTPEGTVFVTDSLAPVVWRFSAGAEELEKFVESPAFLSLQGIVQVRRTVVVSDYANGLFAFDLADAVPRALAAPRGATLVGLDGLVVLPDALVAVQNGVEPQRVVRIALAPDVRSVESITVIAAGQPELTDLSLVTVVADQPAVLANAGWDAFDPARAEHPRAHTVRLYALAPAATGQ